MIFVTVGTQDKPFVRIIKEIDEAVKRGLINEEVVVQSGHTKYETDSLKMLEYISFNEFETYIKKASVVITHGGVGSILNAIKCGKKVIAVPRLEKYKEHINDHQLQVTKKFEQDGFILACYDEKDIVKKLEEINSFEPKKFESNTEEFISKFKEILDDVLK